MSISNIVFDIVDNLNNNNIQAVEEYNKKYNDTYGHYVLIKKLNQFIEKSNPTIMENAFDIKGLWYIPNYLSSNELIMLKEKIINEVELNPISNKSSNSRRVAHYGYFYSYDKTGLKPAAPIPDFLKNLATQSRIEQTVGGVWKHNNEFDQVIINEYSFGQQIAYHVDHTKLFGPIVACITVGKAVPINFKLGDDIKTITIDEGSMYIMTADARYKWQHGLKNNFEENRYSITFRTINKN